MTANNRRYHELDGGATGPARADTDDRSLQGGQAVDGRREADRPPGAYFCHGFSVPADQHPLNLSNICFDQARHATNEGRALPPGVPLQLTLTLVGSGRLDHQALVTALNPFRKAVAFAVLRHGARIDVQFAQRSGEPAIEVLLFCQPDGHRGAP